MAILRRRLRLGAAITLHLAKKASERLSAAQHLALRFSPYDSGGESCNEHTRLCDSDSQRLPETMRLSDSRRLRLSTPDSRTRIMGLDQDDRARHDHSIAPYLIVRHCLACNLVACNALLTFKTPPGDRKTDQHTPAIVMRQKVRPNAASNSGSSAAGFRENF